MNILVTGGAGFIGSNLSKEIVKDHKVFCFDNFNSYYDPQIKRNNIKDLLMQKNFELVEGDIREKEKLKTVFKEKEVSVVIHLAAMAGVRNSISNPFLYQDVNVKGTLNLLDLAKEFEIKNFIFASSSSVYGAAKSIPFNEQENVKPISPYGATKRSGEIFCDVYSKIFKIPITCLRFFTVYGQQGRPEMAIYKFTQMINEGKEIPVFDFGKSKRDYTHISDIVNGINSCINKKFDFEIINLGNSSPVELNYLISLIEQNLDKKALKKFLPRQQGDTSITYADVSKAKSLLGFEPKTKIEEGVKKFVDWYFEQQDKPE